MLKVTPKFEKGGKRKMEVFVGLEDFSFFVFCFWFCFRHDSASFLDEIASHLDRVIFYFGKFDVEVVEGAVVDLQDFVG